MPALRQVKYFFLGGEALPPALVEQLAGCGEIFGNAPPAAAAAPGTGAAGTGAPRYPQRDSRTARRL